MRCGIDPGRFKIGLAFEENSRLLFSAIVPKASEDVLLLALANCEWERLAQWHREGSISDVVGKTLETICLGNGTSSKDMMARLVTCASGRYTVKAANEYGTTLEGRQLYWKLHPPAWLWKLVPTSLRTPPRDIDDLAAFCIIKR